MYDSIMLVVDEAMGDLSSDAAPMQSAIANFQTCQTRGLPQRDPILQRFHDSLLELYNHYEGYIASAMCVSFHAVTSLADSHRITGVHEYLGGACIELAQLQRDTSTHAKAKSWPWWLRYRTGITGYYTLAPFTRAKHPDFMSYIQVCSSQCICIVMADHKKAIGDLGVFVCHVNDILRFVNAQIGIKSTKLIVAAITKRL